jgi:RNA polymerase sigma-70 factor (ECF subfamily)
MAADAPRGTIDKKLLERCIAGERDAWLAILKQFGALVAHAVRTTMLRVLKFADPNQVDDAVQAVWLGLCEDGCRRLKSFESKCAFSTWLTVLSTRRTLDFIRTEMRKGSLRHVRLDDEDHDFLKDVPASANEPASTPEDIALLYDALERLPEDDKLLLKMYYLDGLSYRTIARTLRVAPNTVSSYILRARQKLKQTMAGKLHDPPAAGVSL